MAKKNTAKKTPVPTETPAALSEEKTPTETTADVKAKENPMTGEAESSFQKELDLKDEVTTEKEELPIDQVQIGEAHSIYEEDKEMPAPAPEKSKEGEWVADPSLLKKSEGTKNTLSGTLYFGIRK